VTSLHNRHGVIAMSVGMVCFVVNDTLVKYVSSTLPAPQLICLRGVLSVCGLLALARLIDASQVNRQLLQHLANRWVMLRSSLDGLASLVYLSALFHMPLANATAINMSTPLLIALLSALWLGVRVTLGQWLIMAVGFVGVLLVVQPQAEGFNAWAWVALGGTLLHALRDLSVRWIPSHIPSVAITVGTSLSATIFAGIWGLFHEWHSVGWLEGALLAAAAAFLSAGYYFLIKATRIADMSVIAPFRYMGLMTAVLIGYFVWGDIPNPMAWCGMGLLVGAGLMMLRLHRKPSALDAA
jgi:drug/metabolite transporter (DMT)-like permease